jgi:hypothetical protein
MNPFFVRERAVGHVFFSQRKIASIWKRFLGSDLAFYASFRLKITEKAQIQCARHIKHFKIV